MHNWKTTLFLSHKSGNLKSNLADIKCIIFQGDPLSRILSCLALILLTTELNRAGLWI